MTSEVIRIGTSTMALFVSPLLLIFGTLVGIAALELHNPLAFEVPALSHQASVSTYREEQRYEQVGSEVLGPRRVPLVESVKTVEVPREDATTQREHAEPALGEIMPAAGSLFSGLTSEDRYELLRTHNTARAEVGVSPLTWSGALEESAQVWSAVSASDGCALAHSNTSFGEVVYYSKKTGDDTTPRSAHEVMREFLREEMYYDSADHTCDQGKICGHYTQIVWADTTEVGCGMAACVASGVREEIWTCHYAPAGNVEGQVPF